MDRQGLLSLATTLGVMLNEYENADDKTLRNMLRSQALR